MKIKEKKKEEKQKEKEVVIKKEKKKITIGGVTNGRLFDYFFIYSIVGFIIETLFGLVTKGVLESRQSFLYGPFCSIYGIGAVIMIPCLNKFKKNNFTLFFGGFLIGSIVEYVISLIGELIFNIKWWDYSGMAFNVDGRICLAFSFFWGILAIILMTYFNPKVDKLLDKIPKKYTRIVTITGITIIIIDALVTGIALKIFFTRLVKNYDLELKNVNSYTISQPEFFESDLIKWLSEHVFTDEKILKTFPNIKVLDKEENIVYIDSILKDIQPYYFKLYEPKH